MRWPWVSRAAYDLAVRNMTYEQLRRTTESLAAQTAFEALLEKYHALKASGASPAPVPAERAPADPVTTAINAVAGRNPALRGMMAQAAMEARRNGIADEVIVRQIYDGVPAIEGLPA